MTGWLTLASVSSALRSPAWTFIAAVIAAVAVIVTVVLHFRSKTRKALDYQITQTQLVTVRAEAADRVAIFYDGQPVKHVHLIEVGLENTGNLDIRPGDYEHPIVISFGPNATPLTSEISKRRPADLSPRLDVVDGDKITLAPLLLNKGDSVAIKALVSDFQGPVEIHARIAGIPRLTDAHIQRERNRRRTRLLQWPVYGLLGVAVGLLLNVLLIRLITTERPVLSPSALWKEITEIQTVCGDIVEARSGGLVVIETPNGRRTFKRTALPHSRAECKQEKPR